MKNHCNICYSTHNLLVCNECKNLVCCDTLCHTEYPHYENTLYVICHKCTINVLKKLKKIRYIDSNMSNNLRNLKRKIKTKKTRIERKRRNSIS